MIRYYKLFALLARRGMKKTDLLSVISSPTLAKISKGANIQTDNIDRICQFLECQPGDIMEVITDEMVSDDYTVTTKTVIAEEYQTSDNTFDVETKEISDLHRNE